jgi:flagellar motor protein MotB
MEVILAPELKAVLFQALLSRATVLAGRGRYADAENVLREVVTSGPDASTILDLIARIRAQQGQFSEATAMWKNALELNPENETYRAGIRRIEKIQNRPLWASAVFPMVVVVVAGLGIWFFGLATGNPVNRIREAFLHNDPRVVRDADKINRSTKASTLNASATLQQIAIKVPGVLVRNQQNSTIVQFEEGLFRFAARLKPEAEDILSTLGLQLKPYAGRIAVSVTGCTDLKPIPDGWIYPDDAALGMARAVAVVNHLRGKSGLLPSMFTLKSAGDASAPYPNDTKANMLRNRTVIISISPSEDRNVAP